MWGLVEKGGGRGGRGRHKRMLCQEEMLRENTWVGVYHTLMYRGKENLALSRLCGFEIELFSDGHS